MGDEFKVREWDPLTARLGLASRIGFFVIVMLAVISSDAVQSAEGGQGMYPLGLYDIDAGIQPPPGLYWKQYFTNSVGSARTVEEDGRVDTSVHSNSFTSISGLYHVTKTKLWNSYYAWGVIFSLIDVRLSGLTRENSELSEFYSKRTAAGPAGLMPLCLGWQNGNTHKRLMIFLYTPVGSYDVDRIVDTGYNRWGVDLDYGITYVDPDKKREYAVLPGYTIPFKNPATDYLTGQEFHMDFAAVQRFPTSLGVGFVGYVAWQTTPDRGAGAKLGSFKERAFALGPIVVYDLDIGGDGPLTITAKYYGAVATQNRLSGHAFWLNACLSL